MNDPSPQPEINSCQILSLDGGGIKGLFSAAVLAALEKDLQIDLTDHFDLITGTSTGGIIALALGLGIRPKQIMDFYHQRGPHIFCNRFHLRNALRWIRRKFSQKPLARALREIFGEQTLGNCKKRLVIPTYNLGHDDVYLFKTAHHPRLRRDWKVPAWQVALATTAAPTYFPAFCSLDHLRLIDGGVWANNPTLVGIAEAVSMLNVALSAISVFSLGTTDPVSSRPARLDQGGQCQWARHVPTVLMQAQSRGIHTQATHLLGEDRILRLDPQVPNGLFALDKPNSEELMALARHESRIIAPQVEAHFLAHQAPPFHPLYPSRKQQQHA